jgi:hypothetical protein
MRRANLETRSGGSTRGAANGVVSHPALGKTAVHEIEVDKRTVVKGRTIRCTIAVCADHT